MLDSIPLGLICIHSCDYQMSAKQNPISIQNLRQMLLQRLASQINDGEIVESSFSQWESNGWIYVTLQAECIESISTDEWE